MIKVRTEIRYLYESWIYHLVSPFYASFCFLKCSSLLYGNRWKQQRFAESTSSQNTCLFRWRTKGDARLVRAPDSPSFPSVPPQPVQPEKTEPIFGNSPFSLFMVNSHLIKVFHKQIYCRRLHAKFRSKHRRMLLLCVVTKPRSQELLPNITAPAVKCHGCTKISLKHRNITIYIYSCLTIPL